MGFLIFAYRKLFLTRKINDLQFKSMMLSQRKQDITANINTISEVMSSGKELLNAISSKYLSTIQQEIMSKYYDGSKLKQGVDQTYVYNEYQRETSDIMARASMCNSIFEGNNKAQLKQLNSQDTQIETQIKNNDSQLAQLNSELQSVEKAEDAAAKSEAPKFGLA